MDDLKIIKDALELWGSDLQITVAIEELSELIQALCKERRITKINPENLTKPNIIAIASEIADVEICLQSLKEIYDFQAIIEEMRERKLLRLQQRIDFSKTMQGSNNKKAHNEKIIKAEIIRLEKIAAEYERKIEAGDNFASDMFEPLDLVKGQLIAYKNILAWRERF